MYWKSSGRTKELIKDNASDIALQLCRISKQNTRRMTRKIYIGDSWLQSGKRSRRSTKTVQCDVCKAEVSSHNYERHVFSTACMKKQSDSSLVQDGFVPLQKGWNKYVRDACIPVRYSGKAHVHGYVSDVIHSISLWGARNKPCVALLMAAWANRPGLKGVLDSGREYDKEGRTVYSVAPILLCVDVDSVAEYLNDTESRCSGKYIHSWLRDTASRLEDRIYIPSADDRQTLSKIARTAEGLAPMLEPKGPVSYKSPILKSVSRIMEVCSNYETYS